jgi:glycerol-3-phosphate acyltransferase PlsY
MLTEIVKFITVVFISYLLGAIPTAYLVAKTRGVNIFEVGSGNMGATNAIRALGLGWGLLVWFFDSVKGIIAIFIAHALLPTSAAGATALAAVAAVIGHNWSIFATMATGKIRGGKGAACAFGTMLVMAPFQIVVGMAVLGGFIIAITRYVSLGVLAMFGLATLWMIILIGQKSLPWEYTFYSVGIAVLLVYRFRENIQRLLTGTERRLGEAG